MNLTLKIKKNYYFNDILSFFILILVYSNLFFKIYYVFLYWKIVFNLIIYFGILKNDQISKNKKNNNKIPEFFNLFIIVIQFEIILIFYKLEGVDLSSTPIIYLYFS